MYQVCNHLVEPIPRSMFEGEESRNSYTLPGRYHQSIFKRDVLWEYFQSVRDLKKEGGEESAALPPPRSAAGDRDAAADAGAGRGGDAAAAAAAGDRDAAAGRGVDDAAALSNDGRACDGDGCSPIKLRRVRVKP